MIEKIIAESLKIEIDSIKDESHFIDDLGDKWQEFTVYHHN